MKLKKTIEINIEIDDDNTFYCGKCAYLDGREIVGHMVYDCEFYAIRLKKDIYSNRFSTCFRCDECLKEFLNNNG